MILYAVLLFALWSTSFVINKNMVTIASPLFLIALRMSFSGSIILLFCFIKRRLLIPPALPLRLVILISFLGVFGSNLLESWSLMYLSSAKTCFLYSLTPFWTAIFSHWMFKEFIDTKKALGLCLGILGTIPVVITQTGVEELFSLSKFFTWPTLSVIGATICSSLGTIFFTKVLRSQNAPSPTLLNGITMLLGGGYAFIASFIWEPWSPFPCPTQHLTQVCAHTILLALLSNIICYNIYGWLLKHLSNTFLSLIGLLSPLFTAFWAWCFFGDPPSLIIIFSVPLICFALFLCYHSEIQADYLQPSQTPNRSELPPSKSHESVAP